MNAKDLKELIVDVFQEYFPKVKKDEREDFTNALVDELAEWIDIEEEEEDLFSEEEF